MKINNLKAQQYIMSFTQQVMLALEGIQPFLSKQKQGATQLSGWYQN
jgi:hypothetical protein